MGSDCCKDAKREERLFATHHGLTSVKENGGPPLLHSENVRTIMVKPGMTEENTLYFCTENRSLSVISWAIIPQTEYS